MRSNPQDIPNCRDKCLKSGYTYAGLQDGGICYCGNSASEFMKHGEGSNCNTPCYAGNQGGICGGTLENSVWLADYTIS